MLSSFPDPDFPTTTTFITTTIYAHSLCLASLCSLASSLQDLQHTPASICLYAESQTTNSHRRLCDYFRQPCPDRHALRHTIFHLVEACGGRALRIEFLRLAIIERRSRVCRGRAIEPHAQLSWAPSGCRARGQEKKREPNNDHLLQTTRLHYHWKIYASRMDYVAALTC